MTRNRVGISRLAATAALLVAALGCDTDGGKRPGQQLASPVTPLASQHVSISSSRLTLTVGRDDVFAQITVQALAPDFSALPNGTDVVLTTNLGAFDSPSGGQTITLDLVGGKATARFYPGSTEGSARVTATVNGVSATVTINIRPDPTGGVPPEPAPVETTISLMATPGVVSEEDASTDVLLTATVLGSDGDPFKNAGVFFTTPQGTLASGGSILATNSGGQAFDTLTLIGSELFGTSITVTGHLGVVGGEKTATVVIQIQAGPVPPTPTKVTLQASTSFVDDDGGGASIDLDATVQDQFGALFAGGSVVFKSTLGSPSPVLDVSNGSGLAESTLTLSGAQIAAHPTNSFTLTAELTTSSGTVISSPPITITIVRGGEAPEADNVTLNASTSFVNDDGGANKVIDLEATVQDQFGALFAGGQVSFSSTLTGAFVPVVDSSDGTGLAESTLTLTAAQIAAHPTNSFTITATLTTPDGPDTSSVVITIVRPPVANFTFANGVGVNEIDFTDTSTGAPTTWAWDFQNDTVIDDITQNPSFTYGGPGTYSVRLTVTNAVGSSTVVKSVTVPVP